jgi:hypothetical protein
MISKYSDREVLEYELARLCTIHGIEAIFKTKCIIAGSRRFTFNDIGELVLIQEMSKTNHHFKTLGEA